MVPKHTKQLTILFFLTVVIMLALVGPWASPLRAAEFTVTNTSDSGLGSLRQAIADANSSGGSNTIEFDGSVTGTITLAANLPDITTTMTITGPGADVLAIDGAGTHSIFLVNGTGSLTLSGVTLSNGLADSVNYTNGGAFAIADDASASFTRVVFTGNQGNFGGAGRISSSGSLALTECTFSGNSAIAEGGGLYLFLGTVTISRCVFENNSSNYGGALSTNMGATTLTNCTIAGNSSKEEGGGIVNWGAPVNISNCTISGNTSDSELNNSGTGGGIYNDSGTVNLKNTIVSGNICAHSANDKDLKGTFVSMDYNLIETPGSATINGTTTHNITGQNPNLDALADNGGPTKTMAITNTSPAYNAGSATDVNDASVATDQRGAPRPGYGAHDIGAYELSSCDLTVSKSGTGSGGVTSSPAGIDCGSVCTKPYAFGATVTLTATPDSGSTFAGWTGGGCAGTGTCTVTLNASETVTAAFSSDSAPPPTVKYTSPTGGATSVPIDAWVSVTFNNPMNSSTFSETSFTLAPTAADSAFSDSLAGVISYDNASRTVTFAPNSNLSADTEYTATLTTAVKDADGNALSSPHTFSFTTGSVFDSDGDGVPDNEDDYPADNTKATVKNPVGGGNITVEVVGGPTLAGIQPMQDDAAGLNPTGKPAGNWPYGLSSIIIKGLTGGQTVTITITYPGAIPAGAKYYKVNSDGFYEYAGAVIGSNTVTLTLIDGGNGDSDGLADGIIRDPGGVLSAAGGSSGIDVSGGGGGGGCFVSSSIPMVSDGTFGF